MFTSLTYKICCSSGWLLFCLTSMGWQLLDGFALDERPVLNLWLARVNARRLLPPAGEDPADEYYLSNEVV